MLYLTNTEVLVYKLFCGKHKRVYINIDNKSINFFDEKTRKEISYIGLVHSNFRVLYESQTNSYAINEEKLLPFTIRFELDGVRTRRDGLTEQEISILLPGFDASIKLGVLIV